MTCCVAIYLVELSYGGPEEGGWWYESGEHIQTLKVFKNRDQACEYRTRADSLVDRYMNKGRRPISSVLSTGRYQVMVVNDPPPKYTPEKRPHYE